jgi:nucleotidyltransferase substrate binding protein (TIGR01987 family)
MLDLTPLTKALAALDRGLARWTATPSDEELRDACIQRFEFTYELSWKMLKRRLQMDLPDAQAVDGMTWRTLLRTGAEQGLVDNLDAWMLYREKRNITSHTYDAAKATEVAAVIPQFAADAHALHDRLAARGDGDA